MAAAHLTFTVALPQWDTLQFSWLGGFLGCVPLPPTYWIALCLILLSYVILMQFMKTWFIRRFRLS